jgi:hypothetical protein
MAETDNTEKAVAKPAVGKHEVGRQRPPTDVASPAAAENAADASAQADADRVSMVSRDVNGDPAQSENFHVLVDDDAPDHVKDAHWNKAGEALGAKHVDHQRDGVDNLDHEERARTESRELTAINFHPADRADA